MLIHAKSKWPQEISANLWPYVMRMANEANNITPNVNDKHHHSPMEIFVNTSVASNPKHWQHFGCPTYVLDAKLQSRKPFHKWGNDLDLVSTLVGHHSTQDLWDWFSTSIQNSRHRNSISSLIWPSIQSLKYMKMR
jgi:hypothetical protein